MLFPWALGQALSKALTVDELIYLKEQFALLEPNKNGTINLENIKAVGILFHFFFYACYWEEGVYHLTSLSCSGLFSKCNRCNEGVTHCRLSGISKCCDLTVEYLYKLRKRILWPQ
jgi:hypothetical protein